MGKCIGAHRAHRFEFAFIDEKRGLLLCGNRRGTSEPAHKNTDAILAINLKDGSIRWSFQATEHDIFLAVAAPALPD